MIKTDGAIETEGRTDFLFTYSESEQQQNKVNAANSNRAFKPKFICFYPKLVKMGLDITESLIYGFLDFFLDTLENESFYYTNKQIADMFGIGETKTSMAIKRLTEIGLISPVYRMKANGGQIRFINRKDIINYESLAYKFGKMDLHKMKGNKNKINNNKITHNKNNIHQPSVDGDYEALLVYGLSRENVQIMFENKKSLKRILNMCKLIEQAGEMLGYTLNYKLDFNKRSINLFDILEKIGTFSNFDGFVESVEELINEHNVESFDGLVDALYIHIEMDM